MMDLDLASLATSLGVDEGGLPVLRLGEVAITVAPNELDQAILGAQRLVAAAIELGIALRELAHARDSADRAEATR